MAARTPTITASESQIGRCQTSMSSILAADEAEDHRQPLGEVDEAVHHPDQHEVERAQAEHRERVGGEDDERPWVTAKIAGIESTAKIRSVVATTTKTATSGVATRRPASRTTSLGRRSRVVIGTRLRMTRSAGLCSGSISASSWRASL